MADVIFYEKPGCGGNARQKAWLAAAGHRLEVRSLLAEPWTRERLLSFFGQLPVADWFNRAAPKVKSGEVVPEAQDADSALALMLAEPLLIRRPLMESGDRRVVGFDVDTVNAWLGLDPQTVERLAGEKTEGCLHAAAPAGSTPCPEPR